MAQVVTMQKEGETLSFRERVPRGTEKCAGIRSGEWAPCRSLSAQPVCPI